MQAFHLHLVSIVTRLSFHTKAFGSLPLVASRANLGTKRITGSGKQLVIFSANDKEIENSIFRYRKDKE